MKRASRFSYLFVALTLCALLGSATVANAGSRHLKRQRIAKGASMPSLASSKLAERFAGDAAPAGPGGLSLAIASPAAPDAQRTWGNTGTDFNAAASWTGGIAPSGSNVAYFNVAEVTQPNVTASVSISGLFFDNTVTSGYDVTTSGAFSLTLTGTDTSGSAGAADGSAAAIRSENTSGTNTIDVPLILSSTTGTSTILQNGAGGTLVVNGAISGNALSLRGGAGVIQLNGSNSFTAVSIDTAGTTVVVGNDNALG